MLGLQGEEEAGGEAVDVVHTVHVTVFLGLGQITVSEGEDVPDHGKPGPGDVEGGAEAEESPGPGHLYGGAEEVLEEPVLLPRLLGPAHGVHSPVLGHHAVLLTLSVHYSQQTGLLTERIPTKKLRARD